jgi:hypothetical protein
VQSPRFDSQYWNNDKKKLHSSNLISYRNLIKTPTIYFMELHKLKLKFIWKNGHVRIVRKTLKERNLIWDQPSNILQTSIIKQCPGTCTVQISMPEVYNCPEINPSTDKNLCTIKVATQITGVMKGFLIQALGLVAISKKIKLDSHVTQNTIHDK